MLLKWINFLLLLIYKNTNSFTYQLVSDVDISISYQYYLYALAYRNIDVYFRIIFRYFSENWITYIHKIQENTDVPSSVPINLVVSYSCKFLIDNYFYYASIMSVSFGAPFQYLSMMHEKHYPRRKWRDGGRKEHKAETNCVNSNGNLQTKITVFFCAPDASICP